MKRKKGTQSPISFTAQLLNKPFLSMMREKIKELNRASVFHFSIDKLFYTKRTSVAFFTWYRSDFQNPEI